jgi:transposase InsO family protein
MKLHRNAKTCPKSRALLAMRVGEGWSLAQAAEAAGVSESTARKWVRRARLGESLEDRSSAPRRIPHRVPLERVEAIETLRRLRMTAAEIAEILGMALSTVSLWLKRIGLGKRSRLEPPQPPNRYERGRPGELVHIDIKKLGRISVRGAGHRFTGHRKSQIKRRVGTGWSKVTGWEFVHVCVDDHSRLAYAEVLPEETGRAAIGFLQRAIAWFAERGMRIERVMTDNGSAYRSRAHAISCQALGVRHIRTQPYRPQTNGKAERFIQTLLREWAYARVYGGSAERAAQLRPWLTHYNFRRPHSSLGHKPPASRMKNLVGNYI